MKVIFEEDLSGSKVYELNSILVSSLFSLIKKNLVSIYEYSIEEPKFISPIEIIDYKRTMEIFPTVYKNRRYSKIELPECFINWSDPFLTVNKDRKSCLVASFPDDNCYSW